MRISISLFFLFLVSSSWAQENYKIRVRSSTGVTGEKFELELHKRDTLVHLYLAEYDGFDLPWSSKDSLLKARLMKKFKPRGDKPTNEDFRVLLALHRKYRHYTRDSVIISLIHPLVKVADDMAQATNEELEGPENGIMIDGSLVFVDIFSNNTLRTVSAWSPNENSHPLIHSLIEGILEIYRSDDPKILVEESRPTTPVVDDQKKIMGIIPGVLIIKKN
ncbi:MAG: hypothetical protein KJO16_08730 [Muriicola sp.]|nr:hypothetical protein [Muriicola sp.]NNK10083.1 hypothetical protein [Flavobacteriaceae bacterium]